MSNLSRKIRRKKEKQLKKELTGKMEKQVSLFKRLPVKCTGCGDNFDKTSRQAHMERKVNVYSGEGYEGVVLFCPPCQEQSGGEDA